MKEIKRLRLKDFTSQSQDAVSEFSNVKNKLISINEESEHSLSEINDRIDALIFQREQISNSVRQNVKIISNIDNLLS